MSSSKPRSRAKPADTAAARDAALAADATRAADAAQAAAAGAEPADDVPDAVDVSDADSADSADAPADGAEASEESTAPADGEGVDAADTDAADASELEAVIAQRDDVLEQMQRQRAEFQNYRRRVETERRQQVALGVSRLVESLLPVLDGCDAAAAQGHTEAAAVGQPLMLALSNAGLERIDAVGKEFDPTQHEAVIFEQASADEADHGSAADAAAARGDGADAGDADAGDADADPSEAPARSPSALASGDDQSGRQMVIEELRSGYRFGGRVLRAAMVKVRTG